MMLLTTMMLLIKNVLSAIFTPLIYMTENRPWNGVGDTVQFHYTSPIIIAISLMTISTVVYLRYVYYKKELHYKVLGYIRLFTGERKIRNLTDFYHALLLLIAFSWILTPLNLYFRPSDILESEDYVDRYAIKYLKKVLKGDYEVFREYLQLYQEKRYQRYNKAARSLLDDHTEFDEEDEMEIMPMFFELSDLHSLLSVQYYLYFDLMLREILRIPLEDETFEYNWLDVVETKEDMKELTDLFFNTYVYNYFPYRMTWIPAAAMANGDICGCHAAAELQYPSDNREFDAVIWSNYQAKEPFDNYTTITDEFIGDIPDDHLMLLERWRTKDYSWDEYFEIAGDQEADGDFMTPFDLIRPDMEDALEEMGATTLNYQKMDKRWSRGSRLRRYKNSIKYFANFFPPGVTFAFGTPNTNIMYKDQWARFSRTQVPYFKQKDVIPYKRPYTLSEVNIYHRFLPRWYTEKIPYRHTNHITQWHVKPWKVEQRYFGRYKNKNPWGWWFFRQERDYASTDFTRWLNPYSKLEYLAMFVFGWNDWVSFLHDEPIYLQDGDSPHNMALVGFVEDWYFNFDVYLENFTPPNIFYEWSHMTDSSYAHKLTTFGQDKIGAGQVTTLYSDNELLTYFNNNLFDFPARGQFGFQDAASPTMEGIIDLHHDLMFFLTIVVIYVVWLLIAMVWNFYLFDEEGQEINSAFLIPSLKVFNVMLEVVWTIVPCLILLMVAIPSFALIYSMDELLAPRLTMKVLGHQWFWSYEYNHMIKTKVGQLFRVAKQFDSNMLLDEDLVPGQLRLLEVNKRTYLPHGTNVRLLISSSDVLHSWAVPSLGIKADACPGRLNQVPLYIKRPGVFYGQCSEICGVNHAFMPIAVQGVSPETYSQWVSEGHTAELTGYVDTIIISPVAEKFLSLTPEMRDYLDYCRVIIKEMQDLDKVSMLDILPANTVYILLKNPEAQDLIQLMLNARMRELGITTQDLLNKLQVMDVHIPYIKGMVQNEISGTKP